LNLEPEDEVEMAGEDSRGAGDYPCDFMILADGGMQIRSSSVPHIFPPPPKSRLSLDHFLCHYVTGLDRSRPACPAPRIALLCWHRLRACPPQITELHCLQ